MSKVHDLYLSARGTGDAPRQLAVIWKGDQSSQRKDRVQYLQQR